MTDEQKNAIELVVGAAESEVRTMRAMGYDYEFTKEIQDAIKIVLALAE